MGVWYATREDLKSALDYKETARANSQLDRAIESASRGVEGLLHRKFYPTIATRYFDWPNYSYARSWRLWLDDNELVSVSSLTSGGSAISASDYFLEPANYGPPFNRVEMDLGSSSGFSSSQSTPQRSIVITGTYGYDDVTAPAGALSVAISSTSATTCAVTNSAAIGVGSIITIDSEKMLVTDKTMLSTGLSLVGSSTASNADNIVVTSDGTKFFVGETILMGSERMLIVDISGNNLIVKRAYDGTILATHSGSSILAPRTLTVTRGALGTTTATHLISATINVQVIQPLIRSLTIGEALNTILQENSGYARVSGEGENAQEFRGRGLQSIRQQAMAQFGRNSRVRAI